MEELKTKHGLVKGASILPRLEKTSGYFPKLIIPEEVENKIRYLCNKISQVEWSGILFFDYKGEWETNDLVITCKDIFLMDIGTSTYTEFDINSDVAAYMCEHPELLDYQSGLIHSHNNMATFFSGTDLNTLQEEGNKRNHFVSLIVNNEGTYTAAITRKITNINKTISFNYKSFEDKVKTTEVQDTIESIIEYSNLTILKYQKDYKEIDNKIEELKSRKTVDPFKINSFSNGINLYNPSKVLSTEPKESLFDDNFMQDSLAINTDFKNVLTDDIIEELTIQLLTGNVLFIDKDIIPNKWALSMEKLFDKRFKTLDHYKAWAEGMCEYILFYPTEDYPYWDEEEHIPFLAKAIDERLSMLPKNKYINTLREVLKIWM